MSDLVITKYEKPDKIDCKASEGMVLLAGCNKTGKEQNFSSFMSFYRLPVKGVACIRDGFSHLKISGLKLCLPTS